MAIFIYPNTKGGAGGSGGGITVTDGPTTLTKSTLKFVGNTVSLVEDGNQAIIYIDDIQYSPPLNITEKVFASKRMSDNPHEYGTFIPGNAYPSTNGNIITYDTVDQVAFFDLNTTFEINLYQGESVLETVTTPAIIGDVDQTTGSIRYAVQLFTADHDRYKGRIIFEFPLPDPGKYSIEIIKSATDSNYTFTQTAFFYDNDTVNATLDYVDIEQLLDLS